MTAHSFLKTGVAADLRHCTAQQQADHGRDQRGGGGGEEGTCLESEKVMVNKYGRWASRKVNLSRLGKRTSWSRGFINNSASVPPDGIAAIAGHLEVREID